MSDQYLGEIRLFAGAYAPENWVFCDGRSLKISQYDALYSLIGTTYGGDGVTTFNVPDLRGRVPIHYGTNATANQTYALGQPGGAEAVTLTTANLPAHTHMANVSNQSATTPLPGNNYFAVSTVKQYAPQPSNNIPPDQPMDAAAVALVGGSQAHDNVQPYMALTYIMAALGVYPTPS
jgi:microcystin-dependent protein